jgi:hypothetical protein
MTPNIDNHTLSLIISGRARDLDLRSFSSAEWDLLVNRARAEGVAPLLYWTLSGTSTVSICPDSLQKSLRATYFSVRMNNEELLKELETLTPLFDQDGISVVALKGISYALTIYPDLGLRPMVDLDLLVPGLNVAEAARIAKASGYEEAKPEASPGLRAVLNHEICLRKTQAPYTVLELHHSLVADKTYTYAVPVDWFWSQTEPLVSSLSKPIPGKLLMLTPTAQVLYACAHAMLQHGGRKTALRWYYDLDRLIRAYAERMDWELLLSQARVFEWGSAVSAALSQTVAFFETPIPEKVLDDLSKQSDRNTKWVEAQQNHPASHTLLEYQKLLSLNWYGRFRLALALAIPTPAYMRWRYGLKSSWALPVWYLYRWGGIFIDAFKTAWKLTQKALTQVGDLESPFDESPRKSH